MRGRRSRIALRSIRATRVRNVNSYDAPSLRSRRGAPDRSADGDRERGRSLSAARGRAGARARPARPSARGPEGKRARARRAFARPAVRAQGQRPRLSRSGVRAPQCGEPAHAVGFRGLRAACADRNHRLQQSPERGRLRRRRAGAGAARGRHARGVRRRQDRTRRHPLSRFRACVSPCADRRPRARARAALAQSARQWSGFAAIKVEAEPDPGPRRRACRRDPDHHHRGRAGISRRGGEAGRPRHPGRRQSRPCARGRRRADRAGARLRRSSRRLPRARGRPADSVRLRRAQARAHRRRDRRAARGPRPGPPPSPASGEGRRRAPTSRCSNRSGSPPRTCCLRRPWSRAPDSWASARNSIRRGHRSIFRKSGRRFSAENATTQRESNDHDLIHDTTILTLDAQDRVIDNGHVLLRDGAIAAVGVGQLRRLGRHRPSYRRRGPSGRPRPRQCALPFAVEHHGGLRRPAEPSGLHVAHAGAHLAPHAGRNSPERAAHRLWPADQRDDRRDRPLSRPALHRRRHGCGALRLAGKRHARCARDALLRRRIQRHLSEGACARRPARNAWPRWKSSSRRAAASCAT